MRIIVENSTMLVLVIGLCICNCSKIMNFESGVFAQMEEIPKLYTFMTRNILLLILLILAGCKTSRVTQKQTKEELGDNPYYELDGQQISTLKNINPSNITAITKLFNEEAIKDYGEKAKDGALIIETRGYAKVKYENFFKSVSKDYALMLNSADTNNIQYILNDEKLTGNFEGRLSFLTNKFLKSIKIIDQKKLADKYRVADKKIGVVIKAKMPKDFYVPKKKTETLKSGKAK